MISDRDKKLVNPYQVAVLVIDMHKGHLGESDPKESPCPTLLGRTIIPRLEEFLGAARKENIPVVFVRFSARQGFVDCKSKFWCSEKVLSGVPRYHELNVEPIPENWFAVSPEPSDYLVVGKRRYSAFYGTDMDILLRRLGVETVVLTGIDTDVCVLSSAWDAVNRDYLTFVISDCTHCSSEESKSAALKIMDKWVGWVMDGNNFLGLIRELKQVPETQAKPRSGGELAPQQLAYWQGFRQGIESSINAIEDGCSISELQEWYRNVVQTSGGTGGTPEAPLP